MPAKHMTSSLIILIIVMERILALDVADHVSRLVPSEAFMAALLCEQTDLFFLHQMGGQTGH